MLKNCLSKIKEIYLNHPVYLVCFFFPLIASLVSRCSILDPLKFILAQICFVYLPGCVLQRITKINYQNRLVRGLVSYAAGYALSIIVYLLFLMMSLQSFVLYVYYVLSGLSITYLLVQKKDNADGELEKNELKFFSIILLVSFAICCFLFQCSNLSPVLFSGKVSFSQDLLFWMRNTVAATKDYPLPELSVLGNEFFYHYFSSVHLAFLKYTTRIEVFDLCFVYSYLVTIILLVSGLYVICRELTHNIYSAFIAVVFVLFTTNLDNITYITFNCHIWRRSFGFAEGLGLFCFTFYYFIRMLNSDNKQWSLLIMTCLMMFTTTGLKGPVAAILLFGIAIGCLFMMFKNKRYFFGTVSGLSLLLAFLIPMALFVLNLHSKPAEGSTALLTISATDTLFHSHYFENLYMMLVRMGLWKPISYLVVVITYLIATLLIPIILFILLFKKRRITEIEIIVIAMILIGLLLGMFVSQSGMSQMYFPFVSIVLLFILALSWDPEIFGLRKRRRTLISVFFLGLALFFYNNLNGSISSAVNLTKSIPLGEKILAKYHSFVDGEDTGLTITKQEYEGLRWARENMPDEAIVLSNKVLAKLGGRSFWVSSITEKQTFFESYDYSNIPQDIIISKCNMVESFYKGDSQVLEYFKQEGVNYAVVFKGITPNNYPLQCEKIFENSDVVIVEF